MQGMPEAHHTKLMYYYIYHIKGTELHNYRCVNPQEFTQHPTELISWLNQQMPPPE